MRVEQSVIIHQPREQVFAYVSDAENIPTWKKGLVEVRRITPGPTGVGTIDVHVSEFLGRKDEVRHEFTAYEVNRSVEFKVASDPFPSTGKFTFEDSDSGTLVTVRSEAEPTGVYRLLAPVLVWIAKRQLVFDLNYLKQALEGEKE
jgi:uncharacterized protein YndB with AHSA1/START domain